MAPRLTVIGTGYLGAVHAACMADLGYEVLGVDTDTAKVDALSAGRAPFFEPGLDEVLTRACASGRLRFTTSFEAAAEFGDVHFVCVGTPQRAGAGGADLSYVDAVTETLGPLLRRPTLVVGKSTVPVGTASRTAARLQEVAPTGAGATLAWNPEFLREGHAVADTTRPDRIVVGVTSAADEATMREVYAPMTRRGVPFLVTDLATAELVKVSANAFLATKISFINAMAEVCEAAGADVSDLAAAIGYDERIGSKFLQAGLGFGGGCLPKDIRAFMARAGELGVDQALTFLREVDEINQRRRTRAVADARVLVGGSFTDKVIAVLGAAFKPDSDDVRDSPALHVAAAIATEGGEVRVHDPQALANAAAIFPTLTYVDDVMAAVAGADVVLHLTEWREYRALDPVTVGASVRHRALLDGRNALDADRWRAAGWTVHAMGRPRPAGLT